MDLKKLKYFVAIAECGSFTIAADKYFISQSALSKHIMDLEQDLQCKLFHRSKSFITLTPEGEELLPLAKDLLDRSNGFVRRARSMASSGAGLLRIGYSGYWDYLFMCEWISRFSALCPTADYSFSRIHHGQLNYMIQHNQFDAILTILEKGDNATEILGDDLGWLPLADSPMCVIVSRNHRLASKDEVSFEDLIKENQVAVDRSYDSIFETLTKAAFREHDMISKYYPYSPGTSLGALLLVLANKGYVFTTYFLALSGHSAVKVIPMTKDFPILSFGVAYRKDLPKNLLEPLLKAASEVPVDKLFYEPLLNEHYITSALLPPFDA